ncbi:hypothetical protein Tco_1185636 [Tanacetum coccineum]
MVCTAKPIRYQTQWRAEDGPTNTCSNWHSVFKLIQFDSERDALKKSNLEIIGYQLGLESLEARIVVHQKTKTVYEEDIASFENMKLGEVTLLENARYQGIRGIEMEMLQEGLYQYQAEEGPTDFALMAHLSSGLSSSSSSNTDVQNCSEECLESYQSLRKQFDQQREVLNKSNLEIVAYQLGLESLEARIVVHQKNEAVYEEDIAFLKYDVKVRDNSITKHKNQLAKALREKDDLKLKLEKFETSSMKLTKLINSQISVNNKSGVGFESLSFAGLNDSVYKTNVSETIFSVPRIESTASKSSKDSLEQPKDVRPSAPIIEEWESDSDDDCVIRPSFEQNKPSYAKINFVKSDENTRKSVIEQHI